MNKQAYNEYQRQYQLERYHRRRRRAKEILGGECVKCSTTENLEIDHIDPKDKTIDLSKLWSIAERRFFEELKKCQLLCEDCHDIKTAKEQEVAHGEGISGKKACYCPKCSPLKTKYTKNRTRCPI